jgi:hypothetical protein
LEFLLVQILRAGFVLYKTKLEDKCG